MKAKNVLSIQEESKRIVITITGKDEPFVFLAQYSFVKNTNNNNIYFLIPIFTLSTAGVLFIIYRTKRKKKGKLNLKTLPERQRRIIEILQKNKGTLTQAELEKKLKIPKASLSRNVDSLVRKNLIAKEQFGMTNRLTLKNDKS